MFGFRNIGFKVSVFGIEIGDTCIGTLANDHAIYESPPRRQLHRLPPLPPPNVASLNSISTTRSLTKLARSHEEYSRSSEQRTACIIHYWRLVRPTALALTRAWPTFSRQLVTTSFLNRKLQCALPQRPTAIIRGNVAVVCTVPSLGLYAAYKDLQTTQSLWNYHRCKNVPEKNKKR